MTDIPLELIRPNPFRDFDLHPLDMEQVEKLKTSIDADGFWASVVARKVTGGYEIAFGHHRIEAARRLGWKRVPIDVGEFSDWQMVQMLSAENATQRGTTVAAAVDSIQAICQVLSYALLRWENEATFRRFMGKVDLDFHSCRGRLQAGSGLGRSCIVGASRGYYSSYSVDNALAVLRDSGRLVAAIETGRDRAAAELFAEKQDAERTLREAETQAAAAKTKRERDAAAKATNTAKRQVAKRDREVQGASNAVAKAETKHPVVFDPRCNTVFKVDAHCEVFRRVVTGETFRAFLQLSDQFEFAKSVLAALRETKGNREITAQDIRAECWSRVETGLNLPKGKLRTAPERPYLEEIKEGLNFLRRAEGDFKRGVALLIRGFQLGEGLDNKQAERLAKIENTFITGWNGMKEYRAPKQHLRLIGEEQTDE